MAWTFVRSKLRRAVPPEIKAIRRRYSEPTRSRLTYVRQSLQMEQHGQSGIIRTGPISAITVVRNEVDILARSLDHMLDQGIDSILVADRQSSDGTKELLREYCLTKPIILFADSTSHHYQSEKISFLADFARKTGSRWIIPFDADEFWFAQGQTLSDYLLKSALHPIQSASIHNAFPASPTSSALHGNILLDVQPHQSKKVAFRAAKYSYVSFGNHAVIRRGVCENQLRILHLPWRNFEQFQRKIQIAALARQITTYHQRVQDQWAELARLSEAELHNVWCRLLSGHDDGHPFGWVPRGALVEVSLESCGTWTDFPLAK